VLGLLANPGDGVATGSFTNKPTPEARPRKGTMSKSSAHDRIWNNPPPVIYKSVDEAAAAKAKTDAALKKAAKTE
jgi:hypothetical protein